MIRVLHFASVINGGDFIDHALTRLDRSRFEISALTAQVETRAASDRILRNYPNKVLNFPFTKRNYPRMMLALLREIRNTKPQIVHAHHYDEILISSLVRLIAPVPCLILGHHYSDHIYYLTTGLKRRVLLGIEAFCNRSADRIMVPSQEVARLLVNKQGVPNEKVVVVPYGFDLETMSPSSREAGEKLRREHGLDGKYIALVCCRLNREKGLHYLIQALPRVRIKNPAFRLVIVGTGSYEAALRELCTDLGVNDIVTFVGWQAHPLLWMSASDVVVQPSICESFCQVLVEALAMKKPVIMTPVGAAPEVIGDDVRGVLVPIGDVTALACALNDLAGDRARGLRLGELGRDYVGRHLTADEMARRYEEVYVEAMRSAGIESSRAISAPLG